MTHVITRAGWLSAARPVLTRSVEFDRAEAFRWPGALAEFADRIHVAVGGRESVVS
jgi:hypothetical protein